jgi:hypothetical protein
MNREKAMRRSAAIAAALAFAAFSLIAQSKYSGPRPAKADIPYLLHASKLLETEVLQAKEEDAGKVFRATISGAASPVRTPLPEPIFLIETDKIQSSSLQLFRLAAKGGSRVLELPKNPNDAKDGQRPIHMTTEKVNGSLYRVEVGEVLENGEYCISPSGSSQVFCFQVY